MFPVSPLECKFLQETNEEGISLSSKEAARLKNSKCTDKSIGILHYAHAVQSTQLRRYRASKPVSAQIQDPEVPQRSYLLRDRAEEQVVIQIPAQNTDMIHSGKPGP